MPGEGPARHHAVPLTPHEALLFEAGVKLGGVFHQYLGTPVSARTAAGLARTIGRALRLQPYVVRAEVHIDPSRAGPLGRGRFAYAYLTPEMLDVRLRLSDGTARVDARLSFREDLRYPLMRVVGLRPAPAPSRAGRAARTRGRSARRTGPSAG